MQISLARPTPPYIFESDSDAPISVPAPNVTALLIKNLQFIELMKRMQLFIQEVAQHEYVYREISSEDIQLYANFYLLSICVETHTTIIVH